jgi:hypothetical protein
MKVLDLQCAFAHTFEGWFASEQDFAAQCVQLQIQCPLCGDPHITKKLSAPRLNLAASRTRPAEPIEPSHQKEVALPALPDQALVNAWMAVARQVVANTTDVGNQFAEEARKMHYGEVPERGIRGKASAQETRELVEEGIQVLPLMLPESLKRPVQ